MPILPQHNTTHQPQIYGAIYVVTNKVNGKQYVGQTTKPVEKRWAQHKTAAQNQNGKRECRALNNAIRKYGPDAFDVEAVIACDDQAELDRFETMAIEAGGTLSPGGYNLKTGGGNGRHGPETRARLSAVHKGKIQSLETRVKIGAANKGKIRSPEQRAKMSAAQKGKPSPNKGRTRSPEMRAKMSAAQKGRTLSPEHRAKISRALREARKRKRKKEWSGEVGPQSWQSYFDRVGGHRVLDMLHCKTSEFRAHPLCGIHP